MGNTKEVILQTAMEMFAVRGYQAVSIRDICGKVGIKESSLYYHYKNKQAILDEMMQRIDELIDQMKSNFQTAFAQVKQVSEEAMCAVAIGCFRSYLLDPNVHKMIALLSIERSANPQAEAVYQKLVFEAPLKQHEEVFQAMMDRHIIKNNDPKLLAREYYFVIYSAFQRYCLGTECNEQSRKQAETEIWETISDLYRKMR